MSNKLQELHNEAKESMDSYLAFRMLFSLPKEYLEKALVAVSESTAEEISHVFNDLHVRHIESQLIETPHRLVESTDNYPQVVLPMVKNYARRVGFVPITWRDGATYQIRIDADSLTADYTNDRKQSIRVKGNAYLLVNGTENKLKIFYALYHIHGLDIAQVHNGILKSLVPNSLDTWDLLEIPDIYDNALSDERSRGEAVQYIENIKCVLALHEDVKHAFEKSCVESLKAAYKVKDKLSHLAVEKLLLIDDSFPLISIREVDGFIIGPKDDFIVVKNDDGGYTRVNKTDSMYKRCQLMKQLTDA